MTTKTKYLRAISFIPEAENLKDRDFVLWEGDLYYKGDKSWLKVENFLPCNKNVKISSRHMVTILNMGGDITGTASDDFGVVFTNGKHKLTIGCLSVEEKPGIDIQPETEFKEVEYLFNMARNIFPLADKFSLVNAENINGKGCITLADSKLVAGVVGEIELYADLTSISSIMRSAVAHKAEYYLNNKILYFMIKEDDYTIYSAVRHNPPNMTDKARSLIQAVIDGKFEEEHDECLTVSVEGKELINMYPVLDKLYYDGWVTMEITDKILTIKAETNQQDTYEVPIPCRSTKNTMFTCRMPTRGMLDFLSAGIGETLSKSDNLWFRFTVDLSKKTAVIRPAVLFENVLDVSDEAFILLKIMQRIVT